MKQAHTEFTSHVPCLLHWQPGVLHSATLNPMVLPLVFVYIPLECSLSHHLIVACIMYILEVHKLVMAAIFTSNECCGIWNRRSLDFLFNTLFRLTTKKYLSSALLSLCEGNSPVTGRFPSQRASCAEGVFMSWLLYATQEKCTQLILCCVYAWYWLSYP